MEEAYEACRTIINDNRDKLEKIAQALIDKETLTAQELKDIVFGEDKINLEKPSVEDEPPPPFELVTVEPVKPEEEVEQSKIPDGSTPNPI